MAYILTEQGTAIVDMVRDFMENEVKPYVEECDREGRFPLELYQKAFALDFHKIELPREMGGLGLDYITIAAILEEVGKVDSGFATTLMSISLALKPVLLFGTPEQKKRVIDKILPGAFAAFALTEPGAGSDAGACRTTAVKDGDSYVINGTKCFITSGAQAEVITVFASTDLSKGVKGLSAFLVEKGTPGLSYGKKEDKMGIRLSSTSELIFEDVRVPAENMVGKEGMGFKIAMETLNLARPLVGAVAVGIAQRAIEEAVKYSKERIAFGKPICKNQGISFKLADMETNAETARQMVAHAFELYMKHMPFTKEAAISKYYAGKVAVENALEAIQILGGYGYVKEYPVEKLLRDAKIFQIFEGTDEVQKITISAQMLK